MNERTRRVSTEYIRKHSQTQEYLEIIDQAPNDTVGMFHEIAGAYLASESFNGSRRDDIAELSGKLRENDLIALEEEPAFSIVIPVATHNESFDGLHHALEQISTIYGVQGAEVILFGNAPTAESASFEHFNTFVSDFQEEFSFTLRYVTKAYDYPNMQVVRRDYMDMLVEEGNDRGYGFDHPVLWLDGDLRSIARNYADATLPKMRINDSSSTWYPSLETDVRYTFGETGPWDDAQKLAIFRELVVRAALRANPDTVKNLYPEESGLALTLGSHALEIGPSFFLDSFSEAPRVHGRTERNAVLLEKVLHKLAPEKRLQTPENMASVSGRPGENLTDPAIFTPETYATISGRRNVAAARELLQSYQASSPVEAMAKRSAEEAYYKESGTKQPAFRRDAANYTDSASFTAERHTAPQDPITMARLTGALALSHWARGAEQLFDTPEQYNAAVAPLLARYALHPTILTIGS